MQTTAYEMRIRYCSSYVFSSYLPSLRRPLDGKRVALVAHPASVTADLTHSLDALIAAGVNVTSAFGPQHGLKGEKKDNKVESADELDPHYRSEERRDGEECGRTCKCRCSPEQ